jgi:cytochrome b6-f complex iron-sulfur subunit
LRKQDIDQLKRIFMERREFVSNLGLTLALACTAGLAACSKGGSDTPDPTPPGGSTPRLSLNLTTDLPNVGDFKIAGGVIIIRTSAGNTAASFSALSSTCTHQGCTVSNFNNSSKLIECNAPCGHGSRYSTTGAVNTGPAAAALSAYTVKVDGNALTVS